MSTAQRLADQLKICEESGLWYRSSEAAAELRRLDAVNTQLLEALKAIVDADFFSGAWTAHYEILARKARAAIAAQKGKP